MKKRLLIQQQLSNYTTNGTFILEADSGHQMVMGRVRQLLKTDQTLLIDVLGPKREQLMTAPEAIYPELYDDYRVRYIEISVLPNALATRYDFNMEEYVHVLGLRMHAGSPSLRYDAVYINDPMHVRNFRAMFELYAKYQPRIITHSHFIDNPESPKFPVNASLWDGQIEGARKSDFNFWQCEAAMQQFFVSMGKTFNENVVDKVRQNSAAWDDGYSSEEMTSPYDTDKIRFLGDFKNKTKGKTIIFVPNRIGGKGRSSDYTRCGEFMFDVLPKLKVSRVDDFVVIAGNPSQKFSNKELEEMCGEHGYVNLVEGAFNRDEYKFIARHSDIAVGLYGGPNGDLYGGTAARECIELGCYPLWCDFGAYRDLATKANYPYVCANDLSNIVQVANDLIEHVKINGLLRTQGVLRQKLQDVVREQCSYEQTTQKMYDIIFG